MVKGYMIVKVMDNGVEGIIDSYDTLFDAKLELSKLFNEYKDKIISYDDKYFTIEDEYGRLITYQIIPIYKNEKKEKKEKIFKVPVKFSYYVIVRREAEIPAENYEEAVKILEKELDEGSDPTDYKYIEEYWDYQTYEIEKNENN